MESQQSLSSHQPPKGDVLNTGFGSNVSVKKKNVNANKFTSQILTNQKDCDERPLFQSRKQGNKNFMTSTVFSPVTNQRRGKRAFSSSQNNVFLQPTSPITQDNPRYQGNPVRARKLSQTQSMDFENLLKGQGNTKTTLQEE